VQSEQCSHSVSLIELTASLHCSLAAESLSDVGGRIHLSPRLLPFNSVTQAPNRKGYYTFADPTGMEGWVGLVGWLIADALPIHPVKCTTGKVGRPRPLLSKAEKSVLVWFRRPRDRLDWCTCDAADCTCPSRSQTVGWMYWAGTEQYRGAEGKTALRCCTCWTRNLKCDTKQSITYCLTLSSSCS